MILKAASIGTFDGMHIGHRSVIGLLKKDAAERGLEPMVITFDRHPLSLIDPSRIPPVITSLEKKIDLIAQEGVTPMVFKFNEQLRATCAEEWMRKMHDEMGVRHLVLGYDNTFGCDGLDLSISDYISLGEKTGITVNVAPQIKEISSSAIRKAILRGDIDSAVEMLGRPLALKGRVIKGNGIGHTIGFPTANIALPYETALPGIGVYAATVETPDGKFFPAMVNIGTRPTLEVGHEIVIEVNIIGWVGDLYGSDITINLYKRLRDEIKFHSTDELKHQLEIDRQQILTLFNQ